MCIRDRAYTQHGETSCLRHSINVSYLSYLYCRDHGWQARAAARAGPVSYTHLDVYKRQVHPQRQHGGQRAARAGAGDVYKRQEHPRPAAHRAHPRPGLSLYRLRPQPVSYTHLRYGIVLPVCLERRESCGTNCGGWMRGRFPHRLEGCIFPEYSVNAPNFG